MFAQELSFHKLTADVSSDKLGKVWWGGPLDLVFINWRSCRHCLQNEWPLGLSVAVLKVPAHLLGTPSWKHHWFGLFCKKRILETQSGRFPAGLWMLNPGIFLFAFLHKFRVQKLLVRNWCCTRIQIRI